jgi:hypothetical protein
MDQGHANRERLWKARDPRPRQGVIRSCTLPPTSEKPTAKLAMSREAISLKGNARAAALPRKGPGSGGGVNRRALCIPLPHLLPIFKDFDKLSQNPTHDQDDSDRCYGPIHITKQHCHASRRSFYYGQAGKAFNKASRIAPAL